MVLARACPWGTCRPTFPISLARSLASQDCKGDASPRVRASRRSQSLEKHATDEELPRQDVPRYLKEQETKGILVRDKSKDLNQLVFFGKYKLHLPFE